MPEFAIFLEESRPGAPSRPGAVAAHCAHLQWLASEGRLIAAGPFGDAPPSGLILASFAGIEEARDFASRDPFVTSGFRKAHVRPWHWSRPENGHLGVSDPLPGTHPSFLETLGLRWTAKEFSSRPVPLELVESVLQAALAAPSEFNLQPWRAVVCHSREDRLRLQHCCHDQPQVGRCGAAVVCAVDTAVFHEEASRAASELIAAGQWTSGERDQKVEFIHSCYANTRDSAIRNGAIFAHQLLLAGLSQGLAGFWLGGLDETELKRVLGIPGRAVVAGVIGLGYAARPGKPLPRQSAARLVGWGRWPEDSS